MHTFNTVYDIDRSRDPDTTETLHPESVSTYNVTYTGAEQLTFYDSTDTCVRQV